MVFLYWHVVYLLQILVCQYTYWYVSMCWSLAIGRYTYLSKCIYLHINSAYRYKSICQLVVASH